MSGCGDEDDGRNASGVRDPTAAAAIARADRKHRKRERLEDRIGDLEHQVELLRRQCARLAIAMEQGEGEPHGR